MFQLSRSRSIFTLSRLGFLSGCCELLVRDHVERHREASRTSLRYQSSNDRSNPSPSRSERRCSNAHSSTSLWNLSRLSSRVRTNESEHASFPNSRRSSDANARRSRTGEQRIEQSSTRPLCPGSGSSQSFAQARRQSVRRHDDHQRWFEQTTSIFLSNLAQSQCADQSFPTDEQSSPESENQEKKRLSRARFCHCSLPYPSACLPVTIEETTLRLWSFSLSCLAVKSKKQFLFEHSRSSISDMDHQHRCFLYKNAPLTLFDSYHAIEKFIIDTRLAFIDQYKLFDLLAQLLPKEDNHLTCQGFLAWLVWRVDQHEENERDQRRQQTVLDKRFVHHPTEVPNLSAHKRFKTSDTNTSSIDHCQRSRLLVNGQPDDFPSGSYHQRPAETSSNVPSGQITDSIEWKRSSSSLDMQQQIDRLQSIVLRLASTIDTLNHPAEVPDTSPVCLGSSIKHERVEDVSSHRSPFLPWRLSSSVALPEWTIGIRDRRRTWRRTIRE